MKNDKIQLALLALMLMLLAATFLPATLFAQDTATMPTAADIKAQIITEDVELTVGDPVTLILEVTHPASYQVFVPELDGTWGDFEVLDQSLRSTETNADGSETTRQTIEASLFVPGDYTTPLFALTLSDPFGNLSQTMVAPVPVSVASVLTERDTEIRDIKPQASLPIPAVWPAYALGALTFLTVMAIGIAWIVYRRRNRPKIDNRTPEEVAYDELDRIRDLGLPEQDAFKEMYALVTTCLWRYIEGQYHVPAMDLTTAELKRTLRMTPMSETNAQTFIGLFTDCDLVKFAGFSPSIEAANLLVDQARQLVQVTAAEAAQQASVDDNANNANPPSATTTISTSVAGA